VLWLSILSVTTSPRALPWAAFKRGETIMEWMAWTWPTATFFAIIATTLITFTILAIKYPEAPRVGILRIETTRGDRLFITLLGSAFLNLAWLGLFDVPQWGALIVCFFYALAVFRWV
jgi:predicted small integral membrane protein